MARDLERALKLLGEAAVARTSWTPALDALAEALGAFGALVLPPFAADIAASMKHSASLKPSTADYLENGWYEKDERAIRGWRLAQTQRVVLEQDITTAEERARHPFYQDFLRKYELEWFAATPCEADIPWALSFQRQARDGPFDLEDGTRIAAAGPHIVTFLRLERQLEIAGQQSMLEAYDLIGRAVVLLGAHKRVLGMTKAAEEEIRDVITYRGGRLFAVDKTSDTRFQALLHSVTSSEHLSNLYGRVAVRAPDASVRIVEALPLPHNSAGPRARAMLTIVNPYKTRAADSSLLVDAFRLTPAQVRLAEALMRGGSTKQIAERLSLSHETVRDQLRRIFEKTGTNRQADLLRLLERFSREG